MSDPPDVAGPWRDRWPLVCEGVSRLEQIYGRGTSDGSHAARFDLYASILMLHHFKDWIGHDPDGLDYKLIVVPFIESSPALRVCAYVAEGFKHFKLKAKKGNDPETRVARQDVSIGVPTVHLTLSLGWTPLSPGRSEPPMASAVHTWTIVTSDREWDALDLAREALAAWSELLDVHGLDPGGQQSGA